MYAREKFSVPTGSSRNSVRQVGARPRNSPPAPTLGPVSCAFLRPNELTPVLLSQWPVLADHASDPNCFAERWFLQPSLDLLAEADEAMLAVVTSRDGLLVGLMPLAFDPTYGRLPVANVMNWRHHHSFLGAPLIRKGAEQEFWTALLTALDTGPWPARLLHIRDLPSDGRTLRGLEKAAAKLERPCDTVIRKQRAMLRSNLDPKSYWEANVRKKKRKEINRLANRLGEQGDVRFQTMATDQPANRWIDDFLDLENHGWKGRQGTALACDPKLAHFFRVVVQGAHAAGKLDFHRLDLNGQPIAMLINFFAGRGGFSYKIAFDEAFARYSPGILIKQYNLRVLDRPEIDWVDSCANENHAMIESIWAERREIVGVTVPIGGKGGRWVFRASRMAEDTSSTLRRWRSRLGG